jgi:hypothetical protein
MSNILKGFGSFVEVVEGFLGKTPEEGLSSINRVHQVSVLTFTVVGDVTGSWLTPRDRKMHYRPPHHNTSSLTPHPHVL